MIEFILFLVGLVILVKGADFLVDGASSLAARFGISAIAIGLTVVAFGTSTPELVVSLTSALRGNTDIALGNIIGSNIFNILFIIGISAVIFPLRVMKNTVWKEIPFALLACLLVFTMGNDELLSNGMINQISRSEGFVLVSIFIIFMVSGIFFI